MTEFKIYKNIPMPARDMTGKRHKNIYPFDELEEGDSFFVPHKTSKDMHDLLKNRRNPQMNLASRRWIENGVEGVMIWRLKNLIEAEPKTPEKSSSERISPERKRELLNQMMRDM